MKPVNQPVSGPDTPEMTRRNFQSKHAWRLSLLLLVWLAAVEIGVRVWYSWRESNSRPNPAWSFLWPTNAPGFATRPFPEATLNLLRFDDGQQAVWDGADGHRWEVFYLRWFPGRTAGYLSKLHTPQICLPAAGLVLKEGPEHLSLAAGKVTIPFQRYVFGLLGTRMDVFYCRWPDSGKMGETLVGQSAWKDRLRNVWEGNGNAGQRVLEIVLVGYPDAASANAVLQNSLPTLIQWTP
jgi:hypothetical protein